MEHLSNQKTFRISTEPWHWDYGIWLRVKNGPADHPSVAYATSLMLTEAKPEERPGELLRVSKLELQQLMDEIWAAGIRPTEGSGSAGSLAATERHLADMRALVFKAVAEPAK